MCFQIEPGCKNGSYGNHDRRQQYYIMHCKNRVRTYADMCIWPPIGIYQIQKSKEKATKSHSVQAYLAEIVYEKSKKHGNYGPQHKIAEHQRNGIMRLNVQE